MKQAKHAAETQTFTKAIHTPIGILILKERDGAICAIDLARESDERPADSAATPVLEQAAREIAEYFAGNRTEFTFPMRAKGTPFQTAVWDALLHIPFGEKKTYGQIAAEVDNPKGSRAVGMACNKNPIMIAVPCHRVVGAGGALTGYAGGLSVKEKLLKLEQEQK